MLGGEEPQNVQSWQSGQEMEKELPFMKKAWFKKAYKKAIEFHEKDELLDARDRLELSKAYRSIAKAEMWGGWLGFSGVFFTPFAYRYYKTKAIKGVKVPRNFVLGVMALFFATNIAGRSMYRRKINERDPTGVLKDNYGNGYGDNDFEAAQPDQTREVSRNQRQYEMMRLLDLGSPSKWSMYFYITYQNPARRLPDPKVKLEQMKKGGVFNGSPFMNQRDPIGLYRNKGKESGDSTDWGKDDSKRLSSWERVRNGDDDSLSSWDNIRNSSGLGSQEPDSQIDDGSDVFVSRFSDDSSALQNPSSEERYQRLLRSGENDGNRS
ncbi:YIL077C [Saccharomyces arboricola H-6]|uniref:YIL077C n=1 Tax=Saccharomyces arboricola (strain H-6 / AS 2.3317 / CBS 10644) TaxID=1160507 RepID=J8Q0X3_SACAR|nr:YIL077C [Saccharomyces arboricola H-6]